MRPYLRVANVFEDRIDVTNVLQMNFTPAEFSIYSLQHGDILLNEGQSVELVGRAAMYRDEVPGACFQNTLIRFRAVKGLLPAYALIVFRAYLHNERFQAIAKWTTNIAHLGAGRFARLEFPLPPGREQERIVAETSGRLLQLQAGEETTNTGLRRSKNLREQILAHAFEGKLVPRDLSDEPADLLLTRIRQERNDRVTTRRPRSTKRQGESGMQPSERRSLLEVLKQHPNGLSPEELLREAGYRLEHIDEFYSELRSCMPLIEEQRPPQQRIIAWPTSAEIVIRLKGERP